jgi:mannose-6-phosphate isomerase-like protein (cupin superfamily)
MFKMNENTVPYSNGTSGVKYLIDGPRAQLGLVVLPPGAGSEVYGTHYHVEVDESFYILEGTAKVHTGGQAVRLCPGDVLTVEKGERHRLENDGDVPLKAVFFKYPYIPGDRVEE